MRRTALSIVLVIATAACGGTSDPLDPVGGRDGPGPIGVWILVAADPAIDVPDGARITLTVEETDQGTSAGGTAACNSYGGELAWDGVTGAWSLEQLGATEMGCEPPLMEAEAAYLDALATVDTFALDGDRLVLTGGGTTLTFAALPAVEPAALTGTTWVVNGFVQGSGPDATISSTDTGVPEAELRLEEDGTLTLFTGCRDFVGEWTPDGDTIALPTFGQASDSRGVGPDGELTCDDGAVQQEQAVLAVVEGGVVPEVDGNRLTLSRGEVGLTFRATGSEAG